MTQASATRVLTGINTTGTPHLGNYVGAIRPAVTASRQPQTESFYFLADYHSLIKCHDPLRVHRSTLEIACCWLASGLDPERVTFYRQSDIPEIPQLTWLLTCATGKGLLNRAHAYKAACDKNAETGLEPDDGVNAGLFMYPVLMAADILMFKADRVPVGRDQIQHLEMARDIADSFNHRYGELLHLPHAQVDEHVALLPGLDGRKMSKSYDNTIVLFAPRDVLHKQIMGIVTDSRKPGEPKHTEGSALFDIYRAFASDEETTVFAQAFADGIAWADAKQQLFERIDREIAPLREQYQCFMADPAQVEAILARGAEKARALATPYLHELRHAVGLRKLTERDDQPEPRQKSRRRASFKQYRESDGLFYFKLVSSDAVLLQSRGFADAREAGQAVAQLKSRGSAALAELTDRLDPDLRARDLAAELDALAAPQEEG